MWPDAGRWAFMAICAFFIRTDENTTLRELEECRL
jgi:hypothetical protein